MAKDPRTQDFAVKFRSAARELGATSHQYVESLKFRRLTGPAEYHALLADLAEFKPVRVGGEYQGNPWKLTDTRGRSVIVVEHETGLEILYMAGSVASIVGLVPLVVSAWRRIPRRQVGGRGSFELEGIEKRYFGHGEKLVEEQTHLGQAPKRTLKFVTNKAEILVSHNQFNASAQSNIDLARDLVRHTQYFVYRPSDRSFSPAKFAGYTHMDVSWYAALRDEAVERDVAFDGHSTRRAIERALGRNFLPNQQIHGELISWAEHLVGAGAMMGITESKWQFVSVDQ